MLYAEDVSFYASFDKTTEPVFASGSKTSRCDGNIEYTNGIDGQAVIVGKEDRIHFDAVKNIDGRQGTCSLWVSSFNWLPQTENFVFFISLVTKQSPQPTDALLYKLNKTTTLALLERNSSIKKASLIKSQIPFWQKNQWHNLVISWNEKQINLYIDGEKAESKKRAGTPVEDQYREIILGVPYTTWGYLGNEKTAIDELKIFNRCLSEKEIILEYNKACPDKNKIMNQEEKPNSLPMVKNNNLALKENGAWIITSSFDNYDKLYEDNLIDGNHNTLWQPRENEYPQYLELRWKYPIKANAIFFSSTKYRQGDKIVAAHVNAWNRVTGEWEKVNELSHKEIDEGRVSFPTQKTDRIRFVIDKVAGPKITFSELEVSGPEQFSVGKNMPYWDSWYIWYPEADKVHKGYQPRYFRKTFEIKDMSFKSANIQARSNDYYKIWINGQEVCSGSTEIVPVNVAKFLKQGENVIAAETNLVRNPGFWGWGEFIAELNINYLGQNHRVGTGADWKSYDKEEKNWQNINFDDSKWQGVACFKKPPDGPWGKIAYHDTSVTESVKLQNIKLEPEKPAPASNLNIEVVVTSLAPIKRDYSFIFELGEKSIDASRTGDYIVSRETVDMDSVKKLSDTTWSIKCKMPIPPYTPSGKIPLRLKGYDVENGIEITFENLNGNVAGYVDIPARKELQEADGNAKIAYTKGQASFIIDGEITTPFFWHYTDRIEPERFYSAEKYGNINIYHLLCYAQHLDAPEKELEGITQRIRTVLSILPDARIVLSVNLKPNIHWLQKNPEERLVTAFGEKDVVSYASKKYRQACINYLEKVIAHLKAGPYWKKIVGFQPWTCGTPDSMMGGAGSNEWQKDRSKITAGDFNPQAIAMFREFLQKKYGNNVEALKKAWKKTDVTFENAMPEIKELVAEGKNGNVFRDPMDGCMTFDYAEFLPTLLGGTTRELARFIKEKTNWEKMVFVHYGYTIIQIQGYNSPGAQLNNNNFDLADVLKDPAIDGYIGAPSYGFRLAGTPMVTYFPWSSFRLSGRMYLPDDDHRYYVASVKKYGRCHSLRETKAIIRRNIGADICRNYGAWFADMSMGDGRSGTSWTGEKEVAESIGEMNKVYKKAIETGYKSASEIAVIFSAESNKYLDVYYGPTLNNNLINWMWYSEFFKLGAPFDVYLTSDLLNPDFPAKQYKLIVMMNTFYLSNADKQAIDSLKNNNRTILWFYAPGYVDKTSGLQVSGIKAQTGIDVIELAGKEQMKAELSNDSHPLSNGLPAKHHFMAAGFSNPATKEMHPTEFGPRFRITDKKADIIARFSDEKGAVAARDFGNWKSVYSVIPRLDRAVLRNICRWAGVHIYTNEDVVFDANRNFIVLHNGYSKEKTINIKLPEKRNIYDAITNKLIVANAESVNVKLEECETKIIFLK
ncbi:MAG: LamG-like jellyroll fold domain-containing protein [Victivallaceae bacterium]